MKILLRFLIGFFLFSGVGIAQIQREPTPLPPEPPASSPFLLETEPKLTHSVKVYWTTLDNMVTEIGIKAEGKRPTQIDCNRSSGNKEVQLFSTVNSRCDYSLRLSTTGSSGEINEGFTTWRALGDGTITIAVHGFEEEDYSLPPEVIVKYLRDGKIVGENSITGKR